MGLLCYPFMALFITDWAPKKGLIEPGRNNIYFPLRFSARYTLEDEEKEELFDFLELKMDGTERGENRKKEPLRLWQSRYGRQGREESSHKTDTSGK